MKNKLILLLTTTLLLTGCIAKKKSSSSSSASNSSSSSEPIPPGPIDDYGYGYYNDYYGQLQWENGEDLKQKLHDIIRNGYNALTYTAPNWESNIYADASMYDFEYVDVLYNGQNIKNSLTNTKWQREHVFAASLMTGELTADAVKKTGRATDFHNLFAGDTSGNTSRGNKNFGIADKTSATYTDRTTDNGKDGYSFDPKNFEPGDIDKGRVARAIFYMGTMYKDDEAGYKGLTVVEEYVSYSSGSPCQFAIGNLSTLLSWSTAYSVDFMEMQHNESVYTHVYSKDGKAQGNRNPFVDYPTLVDYVYGNKKDQAGDLKFQKPACYDLNSDTSEFSHYAIESAKREFSYGETLTVDDFSLVKVNKNYTTSSATSGYTHSLLNHEFSAGDGTSITATITFENQVITYVIDVDPMSSCSYSYSNMKNTGINKSQPNVDQNVTYGTMAFTINFAASGTITCTNTTSGGFKMGSGTVPVTKVTLTTVNSYTVDKAFINCYAANASSSYSLVIKIGETIVYDATVKNSSSGITYGDSFGTQTGKVSYIFTGSNALNLCSVAFNVVS